MSSVYRLYHFLVISTTPIDLMQINLLSIIKYNKECIDFRKCHQVNACVNCLSQENGLHSRINWFPGFGEQESEQSGFDGVLLGDGDAGMAYRSLRQHLN